MMTDKENSSSVNFVSEVRPPPPVKQEEAYEPVECEVILYVDNREKKNQQQGNYIFNKLIDSNLYCEQKALPLGDFLWILRVKQRHKHEE